MKSPNPMEFQKRKAAALAAINSPAPDKSPKGTIDAPIIPLLTAINSHSSYFTTSSCSGRISILSQPTASPSAPKKKARGGYWILVSHDAAHPQSVSALLFPSLSDSARPVAGENMSQSVVFRFEPLIIAVECENVQAAQALVSLAISSGFRESGITSASKRVIAAIRCSIRMEVPLGHTDKLMVSQEYLEYLVEVANDKMVANRKRTDLFYIKLMENGFLGGMNRACEDETSTFVEDKRFESFQSSMENEVQVLEGELMADSKSNISNGNGSREVSSIDLSVVGVIGEPVERLFLWGHSACATEQKKIITFGGFGGVGRHERRNDVSILDTKSGILDVISAAGGPSPRLGHTSSLIEDSLYVIGGRAGPTDILNEVWVFNILKKEWMLLQCSGNFFPPRHRHTSVVVGSKIYVFGGICNETILASLYVLDTDTSEWSEVESHGESPGPRHSHTMERKETKLYIYGGYNGDRALGDLYSFDIQTCVWSKIKTNGPSPNRFSHLMFVYSNYIGIFGGCPVGQHQELFLLDIQSKCWMNIPVKSTEEGLFVRSTMSVVDDDLIIIGGGAACYAFGTKFNEPMKINLLQLMMPLYDDIKHISIREKHKKYLMEQKKGFSNFDSEFEEQRVTNGGSVVVSPYVLQIEKQYAKMGKDLLKRFGWLDLKRKVYSQASGVHICIPVTEKFCAVLEAKKGLVDKFEPLTTDLQSLKPSCWQTLLKDISSSAALSLLVSFGATRIVDEVVKVKKSPIPPFEVMKEAVASLLKHHDLPTELIEQLPSRWERLGDIVVLPVTSFKDQAWESIGDDLWPLIARSLGAQRLARQGRIAATGTRDSKLEILVGDDGWVDHRENGILYSFDATKCMFSWGNLSEKLRMARLDCKDQVVVDLFAGIGYFALPFLVRANAKMVYACEWNPHAVEALVRNVRANSVDERCIVLEGDNRITAPKGVADRVCLGLIPSSECSWVTAVRALRDEGGVLHIHGNVKDSEEDVWCNNVVKSISDIAESDGRCFEVSVEHLERVKWYAPHVRHLVVDVRCKLSKTR